VPVDSTSLRDTLFESQLFGHTRGAFTGADRATLGFFRAADSGTIFLDEIGELPLQSQAKLLRCIQERQVVPMGATTGIPVDVRIIAATHRDLPTMVKRGEFREDLYYRLNVASLTLPRLRDRKEDIPLLVQHALDELGRLYNEPARVVTAAAMNALSSHDWPGNVRELMNAIEHALVFSSADTLLDLENLPDSVVVRENDRAAEAPTQSLGLMTLEAAERQAITAALRACGGNQTRAAQTLAIERHRLRRRIVQYNLTDLLRNSISSR
jgi:transcriptional regulator with PAS, ATPase and Fis domain